MTQPLARSLDTAISFATGQLDRLMAFYPRIDTKAGFVMAINIAMLGLMALNFPVRDMGSPRGACGVIAALLLGLSLWQLYLAFFPDLRSGEKQSLIYFGDIASWGWRPYRRAVEALTEQDLFDDVTCQVWRNAEILRDKFKRTKSAVIFTLLATPFWLALLSAAALRAGRFVVAG